MQHISCNLDIFEEDWNVVYAATSNQLTQQGGHGVTYEWPIVSIFFVHTCSLYAPSFPPQGADFVKYGERQS
jgi:hypothetical protein